MKRTTRHSSSPKRLAAIQTSRHLHVTHRKHTGKVLPRTSTSYPMLAMIVLIVGVLIASWTHVAAAVTPVGSPQLQSSYQVNASVPGPAPTTAATIASPTMGSHQSSTPVLVSGSCPVDASGGYVSLYRNTFYSGTALCDASGSYQVSTDLFTGANQLVARIYNFTDVAGPDSIPVTVYYQPPSVPGATTGGSIAAPSPTASKGFSINSATTSQTSASQALPLSLSTDFAIRGYYVGQQTIWQLDLEGGVGPYALAADWGDGTTGIVSRANTGPTHLTHTYTHPGGYQGSYTVKFTATDASGRQTFLQLLVVVNSRRPAAVGATSQGTGTGFGSSLSQGLKTYIWPSYGMVVLMLASFWLGERREMHVLHPHRKRVRHA